jgi:hypothetical protein
MEEITTAQLLNEINRRGSVYVWTVLWEDDGCHVEVVKKDLYRRIKIAAKEAAEEGLDAPTYLRQRRPQKRD